MNYTKGFRYGNPPPRKTESQGKSLQASHVERKLSLRNPKVDNSTTHSNLSTRELIENLTNEQIQNLHLIREICYLFHDDNDIPKIESISNGLDVIKTHIIDYNIEKERIVREYQNANLSQKYQIALNKNLELEKNLTGLENQVRDLESRIIQVTSDSLRKSADFVQQESKLKNEIKELTENFLFSTDETRKYKDTIRNLNIKIEAQTVELLKIPRYEETLLKETKEILKGKEKEIRSRDRNNLRLEKELKDSLFWRGKADSLEIELKKKQLIINRLHKLNITKVIPPEQRYDSKLAKTTATTTTVNPAASNPFSLKSRPSSAPGGHRRDSERSLSNNNTIAISGAHSADADDDDNIESTLRAQARDNQSPFDPHSTLLNRQTSSPSFRTSHHNITATTANNNNSNESGNTNHHHYHHYQQQQQQQLSTVALAEVNRLTAKCAKLESKVSMLSRKLAKARAFPLGSVYVEPYKSQYNLTDEEENDENDFDIDASKHKPAAAKKPTLSFFRKPSLIRLDSVRSYCSDVAVEARENERRVKERSPNQKKSSFDSDLYESMLNIDDDKNHKKVDNNVVEEEGNNHGDVSPAFSYSKNQRVANILSNREKPTTTRKFSPHVLAIRTSKSFAPESYDTTSRTIQL